MKLRLRNWWREVVCLSLKNFSKHFSTIFDVRRERGLRHIFWGAESLSNCFAPRRSSLFAQIQFWAPMLMGNLFFAVKLMTGNWSFDGVYNTKYVFMYSFAFRGAHLCVEYGIFWWHFPRNTKLPLRWQKWICFFDELHDFYSLWIGRKIFCFLTTVSCFLRPAISEQCCS